MPKKPLDPRWKKDRIGRITWRRDEKLEDWLVRKEAYRKEWEEKEREKAKRKKTGRPPHEMRSTETLATAREVFGLTDFEIENDFGSYRATYDGIDLLEVRARARLRRVDTAGRHDGLDDVRVDMALWVEQTLHLKSSEANCDLDCCLCPRARLMNCAAQNKTAAEKDGFPVLIENPLEERDATA